jgi:hypothetical protein
MEREQEAWGGELRTPRVIRWLLHKPGPPEDTAECRQERRNAETTVDTPRMAVDRAILGGFSEARLGNRTQQRH